MKRSKGNINENKKERNKRENKNNREKRGSGCMWKREKTGEEQEKKNK